MNTRHALGLSVLVLGFGGYYWWAIWSSRRSAAKTAHPSRREQKREQREQVNKACAELDAELDALDAFCATLYDDEKFDSAWWTLRQGTKI